MEERSLPVVVETATHRFSGEVSLPKEGYRSRLSDYLNQEDLAFLALTAVTISDLESGTSEERDFVVVGTRHILLAHPR